MAWTTYGKQQMLAVALGAIDPPTLWLALYVNSADPAGTPDELVLAGYARQQVSFLVALAGTVSNQSDVAFGPLAVGSYIGVALLDDPIAGRAWMWNDESGSVVIPASSLVTFAAGNIDAVLTP